MHEEPNRHKGYIIFTWTNEEDDFIEILLQHTETLQFKSSWNPRARFVVAVSGYGNEQPYLVALNVSQILWHMHKIVNIIILVVNPDAILGTRRDKSHVFNIYTWFPYKGHQCVEPTEVVLIDHCLHEYNGRLSNNEPLFPNKIPNNLLGCPLRVGVLDAPPYVILTGSDTDTEERTVYEFRGLEFEYLLSVSKVLNITLEFHPAPSASDLHERVMSSIAELRLGSLDVIIGRMTLTPLTISVVDFTIPYIFDSVQWYVPCPKPALRTEKIMGIFAPAVWFCMAVVILVVALVLWCASYGPDSSLRESRAYRTLHNCVYNSWSAFMGVSVAHMPRTSKLRILFLIFVCYCFAMTTLFQALFTTFLVAPGYGKQIQTFEELTHSDLIYGRDTAIEKGLNYSKIFRHHDLKLDNFACVNSSVCFERLFTKGDVTTLSLRIDAEYLFATKIYGQSKKKTLCTLDEKIMDINTVIYLRLGDPLLDRFNAVIRRCMETGIVGKYWSEFNFNISLQNMGKHKEPDCEICDNMYFVFSLSHLKAAFVVLGLGHALSVIVFVLEFACK
jgi:hypothetical protein